MASKHNTLKSNGRRIQSAPRHKFWFALETPEGRFIRFGEMSKTAAQKQNNFYRKHNSGYKWVLYAAHINEVEIRSLVA